VSRQSNSASESLPNNRAESIEHPRADRDVPSDLNSIAQAEKLTAKITSEAIGEPVGELFMGPARMLLGAELDGKLGAEIGD
jgi:hypothetical protein